MGSELHVQIKRYLFVDNELYLSFFSQIMVQIYELYSKIILTVIYFHRRSRVLATQRSQVGDLVGKLIATSVSDAMLDITTITCDKAKSTMISRIQGFKSDDCCILVDYLCF